MEKRTSFLALVVCLGVLLTPCRAPGAVRQALILHSYHQGLSWTDNIMAGMASVLDDADADLEVHVEYMDTKRHSPAEAFPYLEALYRQKYGQISFDVILLSDNNALTFILSRRDRLFPGVPVVFCGINNFSKDMLEGRTDVTGAVEEIDIRATIDMARRLLPGVRQFAVVNDRTPTGLANLEKFEQTVAALHDDAPGFALLDDISAPNLKMRLARLPSDAALLVFTFHRDREGRWFSIPEYLTLIRESCRVPVFSFWEHYMGQGVLGGVMVNGAAQGSRAAEYALRILDGEPAASIPVLEKSPNLPMLDYRLLNRFNARKENIPPEAVILFKPESLLKKHGNVILASAAGFLALIAMVVALSVNIMVRRKSENALREQRRLLSTVIDELPFWFSLKDSEGRYLLVNRTMAEAHGAAVSDFIGRTTLEIPELYPGGMKKMAERDERVIKTGKRIETPEYPATKGGELRWRRLVKLPWRNENGDVIGVISWSEDITERRCAEEQLRQYSERLEEMTAARTQALEKAQAELLRRERLAVLGHFAGSISHELRNPLAVISSSAYFLNMKLGRGDKKVTEHLGRIQSNVDKSTAIIQSLLSLTRMEKPNTRIQDLRDLVNEALRGARVPETVEIAQNFPDEEVSAAVDAEQIHMALKNIFKNAAQAMNGSGRLTVALQNIGTDQVELTVSDTGPGIAPENLEEIFKPLFTTKAQGIGFGLSITRMIVENHGGTVQATSKPGSGAAFHILLPFANAGGNKQRHAQGTGPQ